jgi:hypothetical protein
MILARVVAFCLFHWMIIIRSLRTFTFMATWFYRMGPLRHVEGQQGLPFYVARLCIFLKCVVKSHFALYFFMQFLTLQHHLNLSFTHSTPKHAMGKRGRAHHLHQKLGHPRLHLGQQCP